MNVKLRWKNFWLTRILWGWWRGNNYKINFALFKSFQMMERKLEEKFSCEEIILSATHDHRRRLSSSSFNSWKNLQIAMNKLWCFESSKKNSEIYISEVSVTLSWLLYTYENIFFEENFQIFSQPSNLRGKLLIYNEISPQIWRLRKNLKNSPHKCWE